MFIYTYCCNVCDFRGCALEGRIGFYVFADGERMPVSTSAAWCRNCNKLTSAENLPTAEAVLEEIRRLENNQTNEFDVELAMMFEQSLEEHISSRLVTFTELDRRFRARNSANRCIECGTTDFQYLRDENGEISEKLLHFNCQGTLQLVEASHAIPADYFTLDGDGNRVTVAT